LVEKLNFVKSFYADKDIVLLGDTNVLGSDEEAVKIYTNAGFIDLNVQDMPTTKEGDAAFDRIFVPVGQSEFSGGAERVFKSEYLNSHNLSANDFFVRFSDHFMVTTRISIKSDDD
jgi:hypothetical protein